MPAAKFSPPADGSYNRAEWRLLLDTLHLDAERFLVTGCGLELRGYQRGVARAIITSVLQGAGRSFVVMFPRQSGKNELQAHIESYLLTLNADRGGELVKVSPTWKPQTLNAMRRLERALQKNAYLHKQWQRESGYILRVQAARIYFFSGQPRANIVGATASVLLQVDEAQDVLISKYDKEIAPMAAAGNATRVFWGTAWTARTLLARELRAAREQERRDGIQRVFVVDADAVAAEVPAYGAYVAEQVARLGRQHPMVKTQYYSEEIDAQGGLFPPERLALMQGSHAPCAAPLPGRLYAMTLDVAGEDEGAVENGTDWEQADLFNPRRDASALTIFEVDTESAREEWGRQPVFRVVGRCLWAGVKHARLYGRIKTLAELFNVRCMVVDATGVGAGLCSFLSAALGSRVIPFAFSAKSKSELCWQFLGIIDSGRYKEYGFPSHPFSRKTAAAAGGTIHPHGARHSPAGEAQAGALQTIFWRQAQLCEFEILPGPQKTVHWGVPDGTRDPQSGECAHDDLLISAALCAVLDEQEWLAGGQALVVAARDPLEELDKGF